MKALKFVGLGMTLAVSIAAMPGAVSEAQVPKNQALQKEIPIQPDVPYVPTPEAVVLGMLELANVKPTDIVYDLGSGDGRLVINAVQKFGAKRGVGVEINPGLVNRSNANAREAGVRDRVEFIQRDLFQTDLRDASVVTLYLLPKLNLRLRPKLLSELKPGSRVVSHAFNMGDWQPDQRATVSDRTAYLWIIPANVGGTWTGTISTQSGRSEPYKIEVKQKYQTVHATVNIGSETMSLPQVKLVGDRVSLEHRQKFNGREIRMRVNGQINGDTLQGTAEVQSGNATETYTLNARRTSTQQGT